MGRKVHQLSLAFVSMNTMRKNAINILGILVAVPVLIYLLSVASPREYAQSAKVMLAGAASMSAVVPENRDNTLNAQLAARQAQLDQREADLAEQAAAKKFSFGEMLGTSSFFISLLLLILVALNFYYDVRRGKLAAIPRRFQVDLR